jgi:hypothetical protein
MKICHVFELTPPTNDMIYTIINILMPLIDVSLLPTLVDYVQGDLRKLKGLYQLHQKNPITSETVELLYRGVCFNDDTKHITKKIFNNRPSFNDHSLLMNETDRTIVGLLWHENVIDILNKYDTKHSIQVYTDILDNICFADYIDRMTFQKQIWQFNEMSSLIKTCYTNTLLHNSTDNPIKYNPSDVRFTKVLTKYSTEYNNKVFIHHICQLLNMDKSDMMLYFTQLKTKHTSESVYNKLNRLDISKLDIDRLFRYIDKLNHKHTI